MDYNIRPATPEDIARLAPVAERMHTQHEPGYFARCLEEKSHGRREVLVAEGEEGILLGYVQIIWLPVYQPFRSLQIPEIQDLNVVPAARRQGLGAALVAACEALAQAAGREEVGIAVGLDSSFGAAQRLYVRLGYVPDGAGVCYDEEPVARGTMRVVDDLLTLKMIKTF